MSIFVDYLQEEAEKKKKQGKTWLEETARNADKCAWATHIGKFTNPSVENVTVDAGCETACRDGYLHTGSVICEKDIAVSANYLATAKLITLKLEDGRTVYEHFRDDTSQIQQEVSSVGADYRTVRENILKIKTGTVPVDTDERIRQVYFPVGEKDYHLLSVLTSSSLLTSLTSRFWEMEREGREAKDEKSPTYGQAYHRLRNTISIGIGGTKPQNISYLNNKSGGKALMLLSAPPKLEQRDIVRPRKDFFSNTLRWGRFRELFKRLHVCYARPQHNMETALRTRAAEERIIDEVLKYVYQLRELPPGWSDADNNTLPAAQKTWLDEKYESRREDETGWKQEIADAFARWILFTAYKHIIKDDPIELGDTEFTALRQKIEETL